MTLVLHVLKITAASLPILMAGERGKDLQNGSRLTWSEMDHVVPVEV
jgi:hypothetical protein